MKTILDRIFCILDNVSCRKKDIFQQEIIRLFNFIGEDFCNEDELSNNLKNESNSWKEKVIWDKKIKNNFLKSDKCYYKFKSSFAAILLKYEYRISSLEKLIKACGEGIIDDNFLLHYGITLIIVANGFEETEKIEKDLHYALKGNKLFFDLKEIDINDFIKSVMEIVNQDDVEEIFTAGEDPKELFTRFHDEIIPKLQQDNNLEFELDTTSSKTEESIINDDYQENICNNTIQKHDAKEERKKIYDMIKSIIKEADIINDPDSDYSDNDDLIGELCCKVAEIYNSIEVYIKYDKENANNLVDKFIERLKVLINEKIKSDHDKKTFITLLCNKCDYDYDNLSYIQFDNMLDDKLVKLLGGIDNGDVNSSVIHKTWEVM